LNDRSSEQGVVDLGHVFKPVRSSRNSFSYMCMTMSLSSAWIVARAAMLGLNFQHLPDIAELDHAAAIAGPVSW